MENHEIRLYRADGTLSVVVVTSCTPFDVSTQATSYLIGDIARAEIHSGHSMVDNVIRLQRAA